MRKDFDLGGQTKICIILMILIPPLLTYIILLSNDVSLFIKILSLIGTMIMSYLTAVIIQDYIYVKKRSDKNQCRHDVRIFEPWFEKLDGKDV